MKLGIVGLPNVGKSTLFNSLTKAGAESANYPFCTIDPNVGVVPVPDFRLKLLSDLYQSEKLTPATIEFVDIAGLVLSLIHIFPPHLIQQILSAFLGSVGPFRKRVRVI